MARWPGSRPTWSTRRRLRSARSRGRSGSSGSATGRWAVEAGYHDQAHLSRECRRLLGVTPGEYLARSRDTCTSGHDHAASYVPMLGR